MTQFKPGDIVEVIDDQDINYGFIGVVKPYDSSRICLETRPATKAHAKSPLHDVFDPAQLCLIRTKEAFKLGDKVRILGPKVRGTGVAPGWQDGDDAFRGRVGYILEKPASSGNYVVYPIKKMESNYYGYYPPKCLELISEEVTDDPDITPQPAFQARDIVTLVQQPASGVFTLGNNYKVIRTEFEGVWVEDDKQNEKWVASARVELLSRSSGASQDALDAPHTYASNLRKGVESLTKGIGDWEPNAFWDGASQTYTGFVPHLYRSPTSDDNNNKKGIIMSLTNKVRELALSKEVRLRRKHGVENQCGERTQDGTELLLDLLYAANLPEIDKKLAEIDAVEKKESKK